MDITLFRDIPAPRHRQFGMGINVLPSGKITFNKKLMEALAEVQYCVNIQMTADASHLLLTASTDGYLIPVRGVLLNTEFSRHLVTLGVTLPLHYNVQYDESLKGWLCTADASRNIDAYVNRATKKRGGKRLPGGVSGVVL